MSEQTQSGPGAGTRPSRGGLDGYFKISARGSTVEREIRGGVVTFLTMAYIIVLNPIILLGGADVNGQPLAGGDFAAISAATALVGGRPDAAHGRGRQLPARAGDRARASTPS